jgi:D-3-phosphoglycerate dehydrogenase
MINYFFDMLTRSPKILIADEMNESGEKLLEEYFYIKKDIGVSNQEILKKYIDFDVMIIRSIRKIDAEFLKSSGIKVIATCSKGVDHIDIKSAENFGIKIINSDSGNTISAAEHTVGLMLNILKRINLSDMLVRDGKFTEYDFPRHELCGKKVGIVGYGRVGSYVGKLLTAFGCNVYANDIDPEVIKRYPEVKFYECENLFAECDIITIHIPMSESNRNFISERFLNIMKNNSIIINTSRGDVIDEEALIDILEKQKIYFAGLDVFKDEPIVDDRIKRLTNVLLTNHIAGKTKESNKKISEDIAFSILKYYNTT